MKPIFEVPSASYKATKTLIANRIKEARLNSGLRQEEVARELNISQSSYSRMEKGVLTPDCAQIRVLSGLYNISILWLLGMPNFLVYAQSSSSSP
jgi:transcriptional regulator with XRE-family HTH domain